MLKNKKLKKLVVFLLTVTIIITFSSLMLKISYGENNYKELEKKLEYNK